MKRTLQVCAVATLAAIFSGCWGGPSPQQQFANALMRGNSMQASNIWLHMSPEDRVKFSRGEGVTPEGMSRQKVRQDILNHYQQKQLGPMNAEEMEKQSAPTPLGARLENLSRQATQQQQSSQSSQQQSSPPQSPSQSH